jgi:hypothetical protein
MTTQEPETTNPTLAYVRMMHQEVLAANRDLYSRAQIALTLDALVVTVFGAVVSGSPEDAEETAQQLGPVTGVLGGVALAAIALSIAFALTALYVRHLSGRVHDTGTANPSGSQLWFYARIAEVEPGRFIEAASAVTEAEEIQIRLTQVSVMSPIMRWRAIWVNLAYAATGGGFVAFVAAIAAYLLRLA